MPTWLKQIERYAPEDVQVLLVGNKADMTSKKVVSAEDGLEFARANGIDFIETSARSSLNVERAFELLGQRLITQ